LLAKFNTSEFKEIIKKYASTKEQPIFIAFLERRVDYRNNLKSSLFSGFCSVLNLFKHMILGIFIWIYEISMKPSGWSHQSRKMPPSELIK